MADSDSGWERFRGDIRGSKVIIDIRQEKPKLQFYIPIRPKAPKYRRGSGPPPPRPNLRPVHDSTAFIVDKVVLPRGPFHPDSKTRQRRWYYIIGWPDLPAARPVVEASKILDYVSPRTLEDWEYEDALRREEEREREREKARELEERALDKGKAVATPVDVSSQPGAKRRPGRPPKSRMMVAEPPSEPELNSEQEEMIHKRMRGPSLSTPQKRRVKQLVAEEEMLEEIEGWDETAEPEIQRTLGMLRGGEGDVNKRVVQDLDELRLSSSAPGRSSGETSRASSTRPAPANPAGALAPAAASAALPKHPISTTPIPLPSAFSRMKNWKPKTKATSSPSTTVSRPQAADSQASASMAHQSDPVHGWHTSSTELPSLTNGFTPIGGTFTRPPKRPADDSPVSTPDLPAKAKPRKSKKKKQADLPPVDAEISVGAAGSPDPALGLVQGEQDYVVKRLEGDQVLDGVHWFRVRWEGDWPADENPTWEPRENIAEKLVKQYLKRKAKREADQLAKTSQKKKSKVKQTNQYADFAKGCSSVTEAFAGQADMDGADHANFDQGDARDGNADADDGPDELLVIDEDNELVAIERRKAIEAQFAAHFAGMAGATPRRF